MTSDRYDDAMREAAASSLAGERGPGAQEAAVDALRGWAERVLSEPEPEYARCRIEDCGDVYLVTTERPAGGLCAYHLRALGDNRE